MYGLIEGPIIVKLKLNLDKLWVGIMADTKGEIQPILIEVVLSWEIEHGACL